MTESTGIFWIHVHYFSGLIDLAVYCISWEMWRNGENLQLSPLFQCSLM